MTPTESATRLRQLPSILDIDAAQEKIGSYLSDLDGFASDIESFTRNIPLEDAVFMDRAGITYEEPSYIDPAIVARLLVFADEALDDLASLKRDAERLRSNLLWLYRMEIIEPSGRKMARERRGDDA